MEMEGICWGSPRKINDLLHVVSLLFQLCSVLLERAWMGNPAAGGVTLATYACVPGAASSFHAVIFAALHMQRYLGDKAYGFYSC